MQDALYVLPLHVVHHVTLLPGDHSTQSADKLIALTQRHHGVDFVVELLLGDGRVHLVAWQLVHVGSWT